VIIGVVDRRPLMILGVRAAFDSMRDVTVVALGERAGQIEPGDFDVVLLDARLAGGETDLCALHVLVTKADVLIVTPEEPAVDDDRYLRAGAKGCIRQYASAQEMIDAVQKVAAGVPVSQEERRGRVHVLSPREHHALSYIASGYTHEQTARRMKISKHTVDTYIKRARAKLNLGNKAELTRAMLDGSADG
jgi:DNA-binding NarL/FixJ family response regulator